MRGGTSGGPVVILVTGGLGFIGANVARELVDAGEDVVVTKHRSSYVSPLLADLPGRELVVEPLDVTDQGAVVSLLRRHDVDSVVHLAAPARSGLTAVEELRSSVGALFGVVAACAEVGVRRLTVGSSLRVYGNPAVGSGHEDQPLPLETNDAIQSVKIAEQALGTYLAHTEGLDTVFLRLAVIYGPGYRSLLNVAGRLCRLAISGPGNGDALADPLAGNPEDAWDLCYVRDCARAVRLVHTAERLAHRVYNVGTGAPTTLHDLVAALNAALPSAGLELAPGGRPVSRPGAVMSVERLEEDVGYRPAWDVRAGVADYVEWLGTHEW